MYMPEDDSLVPTTGPTAHINLQGADRETILTELAAAIPTNPGRAAQVAAEARMRRLQSAVLAKANAEAEAVGAVVNSERTAPVWAEPLVQATLYLTGFLAALCIYNYGGRIISTLSGRTAREAVAASGEALSRMADATVKSLTPEAKALIAEYMV